MFYGWNLCALSTLGNLIIQGTAIYSMNSFIEPLFEAYGWSRTATSACMGFAALIGFGCAPLIGTLDMKIGSRKMMCIGSLLAALALLGMGSTTNYYIFTACFCLVWAASQCCGGLVANGLLCHWFKVHRGVAFGVAAVGMSFAGSIIPIFSLFCITHWGISNAYYILAACAALLFIPCALMVKERPEMMGLTPDGLPVPEKEKKERALDTSEDAAHKKEPSIRQFLCMKEIYLIGMGAGLGLMCASGLMSQLKPRFTELGYDAVTAMTFMSIAAVSCGLSKFFWGWLADTIRPIRALRLVMALHIIALGLSVMHFSYWTTCLYCIFMGACCGSYWTLLPAVVGFYFGPTHFLGTYRFVSFFLLLKSCAYPILGYSYDMTSSYEAGYLVYLGLVTIGFILTLILDEKKGSEYKTMVERSKAKA
jgi:MFS transporter, OFA family, oxalate/formate antiporter